MQFSNIVVKGTGVYLPPMVFSNEDMVRWHGKKNPDWFYNRIGVKSRHSLYNYNDETTSFTDEDDMAFNASKDALIDADIDITEIDAILMATSTPTHNVFPDSACTLHKRLHAKSSTGAFTITAGCCGTLNGLIIGTSLIKAGQARRILVCGTSAMSSFFRPHLKDRIWLHSTIFGDGAAALVIGKDRDDSRNHGFSNFYMGADQTRDVARKTWGGSKRPVEPDTIDFYLNDILDISFRNVPNNIKCKFSEVFESLTCTNNVSKTEIDWILFNMSNAVHQANWIKENDLNINNTYFNMEYLGNCAAASLGIAIHEFIKRGSSIENDLALVMAVGTGLQYGGVFYKF